MEQIALYRWLSILLVLVLLVSVPAHARRVALVVGNVAYTGDEGRLQNAGNDARAMAALLKEGLGFDLVGGRALTDLDWDHFNRAIERLRRASKDAEIVLFYYAGHGVGGVANKQGTTDTWLQPIGVHLRSDADVRHRAISLSWLADKMADSGAAARILIIDACRNHPIYRSRGGGNRGLTRINPPNGTLIAFAAAPGQTSKDYHPTKRRHGLYTGELLDHLATPGLNIKEIFDQVGKRVNGINPRQTPVKYDLGLYDKIVLVKAVHADRQSRIIGQVKRKPVRPENERLAPFQTEKPPLIGRYMDSEGCLREANGSAVIGFKPGICK